MLVAAKLKARQLTGTDIENIAVQTARKNLLLNRIKPERFNLCQGDLACHIKNRFDLVVANLLTGPVIKLVDRLPAILVKEGVFICSGIITRDQNKVLTRLRQDHFKIIEVLTKENWIALVAINAI